MADKQSSQFQAASAEALARGLAPGRSLGAVYDTQYLDQLLFALDSCGLKAWIGSALTETQCVFTTLLNLGIDELASVDLGVGPMNLPRA
jgi:hypothetical protein